MKKIILTTIAMITVQNALADNFNPEAFGNYVLISADSSGESGDSSLQNCQPIVTLSEIQKVSKDYQSGKEFIAYGIKSSPVQDSRSIHSEIIHLDQTLKNEGEAGNSNLNMKISKNKAERKEWGNAFGVPYSSISVISFNPENKTLTIKGKNVAAYIKTLDSVKCVYQKQ